MAKDYIHRVGFVSGVKPEYNPVAILKTALWEARNVDVDDVGVLRVRPGSKQISPSLGNSALQGAIVAFGDILCVWDGSLYRYNFTTNAFTAIRENFLAEGDIAMELWSENNSPVVYLHDGAGIWKTDGTTCDLVTPYEPGDGLASNLLRADDGTQDLTSAPAKAKVTLFKHGLATRLALAYGNSVMLSDSVEHSYFPSDQTFQLPDDGGKIVALRLFYGALIIFRDKDIWAFFGDSVTDESARLVLQESSVGCIAPKSIVDVPGVGLVFAGADNIYALQGVAAIEDQVEAKPIGDDINPYYIKAVSENGSAIYHNREYILSFPDAIEPERVFRYKATKQAWYVDTGPKAVDYISYDGGLYFTYDTIGAIGYRHKQYRNDDGNVIPFLVSFAHERIDTGPARIKTLFLYVNSRDTLQHLNAAVIGDGRIVQNTELSVTAQSGADFIIGRSAIGVGRIGRMDEIKQYEGPLRIKSTFAQVRIIGTAPDEDIGIIGYSLEFSPKDHMKGVRKGVSVVG